MWDEKCSPTAPAAFISSVRIVLAVIGMDGLFPGTFVSGRMEGVSHQLFMQKDFLSSSNGQAFGHLW